MSSTDLKTSIRRRMFLEAIRRGRREQQYGFQICPKCGGRGVVCSEQENNGRWTAVLTECAECNGEAIVPAP